MEKKKEQEIRWKWKRNMNKMDPEEPEVDHLKAVPKLMNLILDVPSISLNLNHKAKLKVIEAVPPAKCSQLTPLFSLPQAMTKLLQKSTGSCL